MKDMTEIFLADTYAIIEILRGNIAYKPFLSKILVTTKYNLIELYYHFLHDFDKETADRYFKSYSKILIPITNNCIKTGMEFKLKYKKEKLSYVDCIGYALAKEIGIKLLTGDQKFKDKENVEFIK